MKTDTRKAMPFTEFEGLCAQHGIEDPSKLAAHFHQSGVALVISNLRAGASSAVFVILSTSPMDLPAPTMPSSSIQSTQCRFVSRLSNSLFVLHNRARAFIVIDHYITGHSKEKPPDAGL